MSIVGFNGTRIDAYTSQCRCIGDDVCEMVMNGDDMFHGFMKFCLAQFGSCMSSVFILASNAKVDEFCYGIRWHPNTIRTISQV